MKGMTSSKNSTKKIEVESDDEDEKKLEHELLLPNQVRLSWLRLGFFSPLKV